jgi:hypothetical protein
MTTDAKDKEEPRDEGELTLNKETLEDLDARDEADDAKGGAAGGDTSGAARAC